MTVPPAPRFPKRIIPEWATFVAGRRPEFKLHNGRGQAKNAVLYEVQHGPRGGTIYHYENDEWVPVFTYEQDWHCFICGELIANRRYSHKVDYRAPREQTRYVHYQYGYQQDPGKCYTELLEQKAKARGL